MRYGNGTAIINCSVSNDFCWWGNRKRRYTALMLGAPSQKDLGVAPLPRGRSPYRPRPNGLGAACPMASWPGQAPCALAALSALPVWRAQAAVHLTQGKRLVPQFKVCCAGAIAVLLRFTLTAAKRRSNEKALRKRDARNAQALRLAHVSAGWGVPPDRRRATPEAGGQGNRRGFPPASHYTIAGIRHFSLTFPHSLRTQSPFPIFICHCRTDGNTAFCK